MEQSRIQGSFFIGLFGIVLILNFFVFKAYFTILLIALTLAVIFRPVHKKIVKWLKHDTIAAFVTALLVFIIVLVPIIFFGQKIIFESRDLYNSLSTNTGSPFMNSVVGKLRGFSDSAGLNLDFNQYLKDSASSLFTNLGAVFSSVVRILFSFMLMLFSLFFFLRDGQRLKRSFHALSPFSEEVDQSLLDKMEAAINSVIRGQMVVAITQGLVAIVGMSIFGVPNPVLWGAVTVIAAFIPTVGVTVVMVPAVAYLYFNGHISAAIGLGIWAIIAVSLIDNMLAPILINRGLKIHPFIVLLSVIGGLSAFGMIGFVLGPLILALLVALFEARSVLIKK